MNPPKQIDGTLFAQRATAEIPRILTQLDRNRHSPTYGCFDRLHWHYRVTDFPSGMSQEFVWPLALVFDTAFPGNAFHQQEALRDWAVAGIRFAASSAHSDASCDDYFPYERADGAAAFSLLACSEAYRLLGLDDGEALAFFERRAALLADHQEAGRLTNHHALIALGLDRVGELLGTDRWRSAVAQRVEQILAWQDPEGWFPEYEGFDPGYHTLTVWCLARMHEIQRAPELEGAIRAAVELAADFVHPDGSYGGEYGSRNTFNFFPAGFELAGGWLPTALTVNDRFLDALSEGRAPCYSDDRIMGHHAWNYLLAYRDYRSPRPARAARGNGHSTYPRAGVLVDRRDGAELYLALQKGGVFKLFHDDRLAASDTGWSVISRKGRRRVNAVSNLMGGCECAVSDDVIEIRGRLANARHKQMTPWTMIVLRAFMLTVGRFFPNAVRRMLQKMLITGREESEFTFTRKLSWSDGRWHLEDTLVGPWEMVERVALGTNQASNYNVMSRVYQPGDLLPWRDFTETVAGLPPGTPLVARRTLGP